MEKKKSKTLDEMLNEIDEYKMHSESEAWGETICKHKIPKENIKDAHKGGWHCKQCNVLRKIY